jgi:hypothetical protein
MPAQTNQDPFDAIAEDGQKLAIAAEDARKPKIGQTFVVYGVQCRITKVHSLGALDVVSLDGERAWRITGLPFL